MHVLYFPELFFRALFFIEEMDRINEIKEKRDKIANYYDSKLTKLGCNIPRITEGEIHGRYFYMFCCKKRNGLSKYLTNNGVENKIFYSPLTCDAAIYKNKVKLNLPNARKLLKKSLSIPLHENMTMKQAKYVVESIKKFYN